MIDNYYVFRWTYRYLVDKYYYSKCKRFETEEDLNRFRFELYHRTDIEIVEWSKEYIEKWKKGNEPNVLF